MEGFVKRTKSKVDPIIHILGEGAQLELYAWPPGLEKPSPESMLKDEISKRDYVCVKVPMKGLTNQPRKTICYGHVYQYSGQEHPVEKETPPIIQKMYETTNEMFNVNTNMCLLNIYKHGYHSISAHSDADKQMGCLKDVYCWVLGEPRKAVFKNKKTNQKWEIMIPEGLYVMRGPNFQRDFTHEFPKVENTAFQKVFLPHCPFNDDTNKTSLEKADWLYNNRETLLPKLGKKFEKWCKPRISWTLRQFEIKN